MLTAQQFANSLKLLVKPPALIAGPMPAPLRMAKGRYRHQIIIRSPSVEEVSAPIKQALRELKCPPEVHVAVDVDALSMM